MGTERVYETQKVWEAQAELENVSMWDVQAEAGQKFVGQKEGQICTRLRPTDCEFPAINKYI